MWRKNSKWQTTLTLHCEEYKVKTVNTGEGNHRVITQGRSSPLSVSQSVQWETLPWTNIMANNLKSLLASLLLLTSTAAQEVKCLGLLKIYLHLNLQETTKACEDMELLELPSAYATTIMMNIQLGREQGFSLSLYEAADNDLGKSFISAWEGQISYKY